MKKGTVNFMAGVVTGAMLFSCGAAYAAGILAEHTPQTAYVDGATVQLDAYNIGGFNYVKLRDIGQAVGFNVYWDGQSVQMDSGAPYTGTGPTQGTTVNATVGSIDVGGFKGSTLKAGERTPLIIYPNTPQDVITSSHPAILTVENVMGHWTVLAKSPGTAVITVTAANGQTGSAAFTVIPSTNADSIAPPAASGQSGITLTDNLEIRMEMIHLINEVRRENGVAELPVSATLMDAAQTISNKLYTTHHSQEEVLTARSFGYPYGFKSNMTAFTGAVPAYIPQTAVRNWINSPGHFQAMIAPNCDCIGVGVTVSGTTTYCYMFAGVPNSSTMYG